MCERFSDLRCKEVINVSDGCRLGFVGDLELDTECGKVLAIIVPKQGKFFGLFPCNEEFCIPWPCIRRIGGDIILVDVCLAECKRQRPKKGFW